MAQKTVSIIGAGNSGLALAANLERNGYHVCLYSHPNHSQNLDLIQRQGTLTSKGIIEGTHKIELLTKDLSQATDFSQNIMLALPSYAQNDMFTAMAPLINNNHRIINLNGNLSTFLLASQLQGKTPALYETNSAPHASRAQPDGSVMISGLKQFIPIAKLNGTITDSEKLELQHMCNCDLECHPGIIAVALQAYNGVLHPAPSILNAGWTEAKDRDYLFYTEGLSPSVGKIVEAIDSERLEIAKRHGYTNLRTTLEALKGIYGGQTQHISEFAKNADVYKSIIAPQTMDNRYICEDIPFILVPWYQLGQEVGYEASNMRSLINLASTMHDTDYLSEGRTLEKIGFKNQPANTHAISALKK